MTTFEDLLKAYVAGERRYESRWVMSEQTAATIRAIKDPRGLNVWTPRIGGGPGEIPRSEHELLMGIPVEIRDGVNGVRLERV